MCYDLVLMMFDSCLCHWAHISWVRLQHVGVIRRKHSRCGANNGTEPVVHFLGLGLVDSRLERGASSSSRAVGRNGRVAGEIVMVVRLCAYDRALFNMLTKRDGQAGNVGSLLSGHLR